MAGETGTLPAEAEMSCAGAATRSTAAGKWKCAGAARGCLQKQDVPRVVSQTAVVEQDTQQQKQQQCLKAVVMLPKWLFYDRDVWKITKLRGDPSFPDPVVKLPQAVIASPNTLRKHQMFLFNHFYSFH